MCRLLGTPNETIWPGVSQHRDWHEFPQWRPQDLSLAVPGLSAVGLDLLAVSVAACEGLYVEFLMNQHRITAC